ncbi:MAG TPA: hypothetical protein VFU07_01165 [Candidatus Lumbricidophila sp.]|nr:hypothetical protein [Candidatus Lumbricidophila sp.]
MVPIAGSPAKAGIKSLKAVFKGERAAEAAATGEAKAIRADLKAAQPAPQLAATATGGARGWKVGDPIDKLTKAGNEPAWSTVRARYWKNSANVANDGEYTALNLARMQSGNRLSTTNSGCRWSLTTSSLGGREESTPSAT